MLTLLLLYHFSFPLFFTPFSSFQTVGFYNFFDHIFLTQSLKKVITQKNGSVLFQKKSAIKILHHYFAD
jgi:hypothetical protein